METQSTLRNWQWRHKKTLISLVISVIACIVIIWYLSDCTCHADVYNRYVFSPYQFVRNKVLEHVPVSVGDVMYVCWGIGLIILIIKWISYLIYIREYGNKLLYSIFKAFASLVSLYLIFIISWGGNYYKSPLEEYWMLDKAKWDDSSIVEYDRYLVGQLNALAPYYKDENFKTVVDKAGDYYAAETDCYHNAGGLYIKPSFFGNLMQYMGVQGYYNPLTGEGQVNQGQPAFMFPFVVTHEMAHQAGIGAEDDANLLAYAVSVKSDDTTFLYSAYFNIWLYTHFQLRMRDTLSAYNIKKELNPLTLAQLDTLKQLRRKYRSQFGNYTGDMYDQYLKMNNQKDGIESYDKVTVSAWLWEQRRRSGVVKKIYIP